MGKGSAQVLDFEKPISVSNDFCHIGMLGDSLVIAVRGSDDFEDWKKNFGLDFDNELLGRILSYIEISGFQFKKIYLTGHSRGGVIAQMIAFKLLQLGLCKVQAVVTFGSPRIKHPKKHKGLYKHYRYVNGSDSVPKTPPKWYTMFRRGSWGHHGQLIHINKRNFIVNLFKVWGVLNYHFISDYKKAF